jgi:cyclin-dependent kinase regulatory subunit CKS1
MPHYPDEIEYSDKYIDDHYEYRHVLLPKDTYKKMPRGRLLSESVIDNLKVGMESPRRATVPWMVAL